jgi:hypothetical protein
MNGTLDSIHFKSPEIQREWMGTRPTLRLVVADMKEYCVLKGMPFCVTDLTSTLAEDKKYKRQSATHREGRAADLRCKHWPEWFIEEFIEHFESKYKSVAAQVGAELKSNLIERHVGTEDHIHVQIRRNV